MPSLEMRRGRRKWRGYVMVGGKKTSRWFEDDSKASQRAAAAWELEERRRLETQEEKTATVCCPSLLEWAQAYLDDVEPRQAKTTYEEKRAAFRRLLAALDPLTPVDRLDAGQALTHLRRQAKERSGNAANKDRKDLGHGWEWGRRYLTGFPKDQPDPFRAVAKFPVKREGRYVPPEVDLRKVVELTDGQDRVMLTAFLHTAARRSEVFKLKRSDLDFEKGMLRLWTSKRRNGNREGDWLPMTEELKEALAWWLDNRPVAVREAEHVFLCLEETPFTEEHYGKPFLYRHQFLRRLCAKAGVQRFGFHAIRHLTAVSLYRAGKPLALIQKILRHGNAATTETYLKSLGLDLGQAREALEGALAGFAGLRRPAGKLVALKQAANG